MYGGVREPESSRLTFSLIEFRLEANQGIIYYDTRPNKLKGVERGERKGEMGGRGGG